MSLFNNPFRSSGTAAPSRNMPYNPFKGGGGHQGAVRRAGQQMSFTRLQPQNMMPRNPFRQQQTTRSTQGGNTAGWGGGGGWSAAAPSIQMPDLSGFTNAISGMNNAWAQQAAADRRRQQQALAAQLNALKSQYPTKPPSLSREEIAAFEARRREASRVLQEAMAQQKSEKTRLGAQFEQFKNRLERDSATQESSERMGLAGRGLAFSPRFMGRALQAIRDREADQLSEGRTQLSDQHAKLSQMVSSARQARDSQHAMIRADEARARTELQRLFQQQQRDVRGQMSALSGQLSVL